MLKHRTLIARVNTMRAKAAGETRVLMNALNDATAGAGLRLLPLQAEVSAEELRLQEVRTLSGDPNTDIAAQAMPSGRAEMPDQGLENYGSQDGLRADDTVDDVASRLERFRNVVTFLRDWT